MPWKRSLLHQIQALRQFIGYIALLGAYGGRTCKSALARPREAGVQCACAGIYFGQCIPVIRPELPVMGPQGI